MDRKMILLSVAVLVIGFFGIPNTLSLFAGQHTFDAGDQVKCEKCHQDIYDEIADNGHFGNSTAHSSPNLVVCQGCHRTGNITMIPVGKYPGQNSYNYSGKFNQSVGQQGAHAAVTMECVACHTGVPDELTNSSEAHGEYYNGSISNATFLKGGNAACIGCHTHTNIIATWRRSIGMDLVINETTDGNYSITFIVNSSVNTTNTSGGSVESST